MRLLVLGGTEFVGRALVDDGLRRGWDVTTFNRGSKPPRDGVDALIGDRRVGLDVLADDTWDIVADTWSLEPAPVATAANALASRADRYVYISSRSVYRQPALDAESSPLVDAEPDDASDDDYAVSKAGGELAVIRAFGDRALLPRPGCIVGPWEDTGRLNWWLARVARGGDILAPGPADSNIQYVDARDLAEWSLSAAERGVGGAFDIVSPASLTTMRLLLETCLEVTGSTGSLRWASPEAILAADIAPWTELPFWLPPGDLHVALHEGDVSKAVAAGLEIRPLIQTVTDTWAWLQEQGTAPMRSDRPDNRLRPEKEEAFLATL